MCQVEVAATVEGVRSSDGGCWAVTAVESAGQWRRGGDGGGCQVVIAAVMEGAGLCRRQRGNSGNDDGRECGRCQGVMAEGARW